MSKPEKKGPKTAASTALDVPVYQCTEDEQVDLLAQALLREYMHKKKFSATLGSFDTEHPRDDRTVSSRAVMYDLMALAQTMPGLKDHGIETVMEALCFLRVNKKTEADDVAHLRLELEAIEKEEASLKARCVEVEAAVAARSEAAKAKREAKKAKLSAETGTDGHVKKEKKTKEGGGGKKGSAHKLMSIEELLERDDVPVAKPAVAHQQKPAPTQDTTPSPTSTQSNPKVADDEDETDDEDEYEVALRAIKTAERARVAQGGGPAAGNRRVGWDAEPEPADDTSHTHRVVAHDDPTAQPAVTSARPPFRGPTDGELGETAALAMMEILTGSKRMIPQSFQQQGWYHSSYRGAPAYGLEQRSGGPCGILAVVQARLIQRMLHPTSSSHGDFDASLLSALAGTIAKVAMASDTEGEPRAFVVLPPLEDAWPSAVVPNSVREQKQWLALLRVRSIKASASVVEDALRSTGALSAWSKHDGSGLLCLLVACVLSRGGAEACLSDMDTPSALIVNHGYCSQELTNLFLCGRCTSNAIDGKSNLSGLVIQGFPGPLDVGFLTVLESRGLMHTEKFGKYPTQSPAAWVVYNESHYTVLFADERVRANTASGTFDKLPQAVDLYYYDQQGQQDEEIRLTVTVPSGDGARKSQMPRRVTALTSYVDLVIRTLPQWSEADVNWNGTEPLL